MFTEYDKAIAAFLTAGAQLLFTFNLLPGTLSQTAFLSVIPFVTGILVWLIPNKKPTTEVAKAGVAANVPAPTNKLLGLALGALFLLPLIPGALADGPVSRGRITAYSNPDEVPSVVGSFYAGVFIQGALELDDESLAGGLALGYAAKLRNGLVLGVEADALRRFQDVEEASEVDQWLFSLRARAGFMLLPNLLAYGTAGPAWQGGDIAMVWGGGLEVGLWDRVSLRGEVLRYEFDEGQNVARLGLNVRF